MQTLPPRVKNMTGQTFGRLTVVRLSHIQRNAFWLCRCECGNETVVHGANLRNGHIQTCGCSWGGGATHHLTKHSEAAVGRRTTEYQTWGTIKTRCYNSKHDAYPYYGGRGITVCERWLHSFENFLADMGRKPTPKHTIDRIDPDGNYEPTNCRWATRSVQSSNQRPRKRKK